MTSSFGQLRPIREDEVELVRLWRNAPSVRNNMFTRHEISKEEHHRWWQSLCSREDQQYFIYERNNIRLGVVNFTAIDRINKNCFWGFYASPDAPRGSGRFFGFLALEYAFSTLLLQKLYGEVLAFNTKSIQFHQTFGFHVEGVFRQQHKMNDSFIDVYRFGLFHSEWEMQRTRFIRQSRV